jgi:hypothetical protein
MLVVVEHLDVQDQSTAVHFGQAKNSGCMAVYLKAIYIPLNKAALVHVTRRPMFGLEY